MDMDNVQAIIQISVWLITIAGIFLGPYIVDNLLQKKYYFWAGIPACLIPIFTFPIILWIYTYFPHPPEDESVGLALAFGITASMIHGLLFLFASLIIKIFFYIYFHKFHLLPKVFKIRYFIMTLKDGRRKVNI
jgi:hypothetical protein